MSECTVEGLRAKNDLWNGVAGGCITGGALAMKALVLVPSLWTLAEWTRGWLFTGFPWLGVGYSQIPVSPLSGYAPVLGIHGVTLATVATAGTLFLLARRVLEHRQAVLQRCGKVS